MSSTTSGWSPSRRPTAATRSGAGWSGRSRCGCPWPRRSGPSCPRRRRLDQLAVRPAPDRDRHDRDPTRTTGAGAPRPASSAVTRGRLEAFSDAVIAIVMTIMVLELVPPHEATLEAVLELWPNFLAYVLSFVHLAIYWNNHHHLLQAARTVSGRVLWTNMHLLFWLSLVPFSTAWMGETGFQALPTAAYGVVLLCPPSPTASSWSRCAAPRQTETLAEALGDDRRADLAVHLPRRGPDRVRGAGVSVALYATVAGCGSSRTPGSSGGSPPERSAGRRWSQAVAAASRAAARERGAARGPGGSTAGGRRGEPGSPAGPARTARGSASRRPSMTGTGGRASRGRCDGSPGSRPGPSSDGRSRSPGSRRRGSARVG